MRKNSKETRTENKNNHGNKMKDSFLLVSLEENKSKKLAEVISNDSCRKILDYLGNKKDATETDIGKDLKIPISTVHYNLKALQEANLVIVEEFHYSKKGKEVNHYSLANKFIIIAPKQESSKLTDALKKIMPFAIISVAVAGIMQLFGWFLSNSSYSAMKYAPTAASEYSSGGLDVVSAGANSGAEFAPRLADASSFGTEISRPFMQSEFVVYFLIAVLSVIIIYFIYEMIRKK